jgi:hypothetical protein
LLPGFQQNADVDCPAYNLKIVPAHQQMAKHRKETARVDAAEAVENIEANAARGTLDAGQIHSFSRTIAKEHGEKAAVLLQYLACQVAVPVPKAKRGRKKQVELEGLEE